MTVTFHRLADGIYAFGDGPFRAKYAVGGPFVDATAGWIWLLDLREKQLTPVQREQWAILYDAYAAWAKRREPTVSTTERWAGLAALLEGLARGEMFGLGKTTLPQLAKCAAGEDWRVVLGQLEAAAKEVAA